jgi:bacterial/archaeal transporter family protein
MRSKMNPYFIIAIISTVLFGVVTIMQKKTSGIDSVTFTMISLGASFLAVFIYWIFSPNKSISMNGVNYSILAGIISGFAFLFFIIALRMCKVSTVVIINSFNAVIAVLLAVVLLRERLTVTQILGVVMGISGVILVTI